VEGPGCLAEAHSLDEQAEQTKTLGRELCCRPHGLKSQRVVAPKTPQVVLDPIDQRRVGRGIDSAAN